MKKASILQKKAIARILEEMEKGGKVSVSKIMREVGYSPVTAKNPQRLMRSQAWNEMLEKAIPDKKIVKKIKEGLNATRVISANVMVKSDDPTIKIKQATARDVDFIEVPDFATRHKFVETILRLKNKFPPQKTILGGDNGIPIKFEIIAVKTSEKEKTQVEEIEADKQKQLANENLPIEATSGSE